MSRGGKEEVFANATARQLEEETVGVWLRWLMRETHPGNLSFVAFLPVAADATTQHSSHSCQLPSGT
jgi:hypothetical protein